MENRRVSLAPRASIAAQQAAAYMNHAAKRRVYFMDLHEGPTADMAEWTLHAHMAVLVLAILSAILSLIQVALNLEALAKLTTSSISSKFQMGGISTATWINIGVNFVWPAIFFMCVRRAIQKNKARMMQYICVVNVFTTCWYFALAVCGFLAAVSLLNMKAWVSALDCGQTGWNNIYDSSYNPNNKTQSFSTYAPSFAGKGQASCKDAQTTAESLTNASIAMSLLSAIVLFVQMLFNCFGTLKTNEALGILKKGIVFVGAPPRPRASQMCDDRTAQPQLVVGQPMNQRAELTGQQWAMPATRVSVAAHMPQNHAAGADAIGTSFQPVVVQGKLARPTAGP